MRLFFRRFGVRLFIVLCVCMLLVGGNGLNMEAAAYKLRLITLNLTSVIGGDSSEGTIILSRPAPSGGAVVSLSSSNTSVARVPASITIYAGASSATFPISTSVVSAPTSVTISATYGYEITAQLIVLPEGPTPESPTLSSLTLNPATVTGGVSSQGTLTLSAPAPSAGAVVSLSNSNSSVATAPDTVTVPAGATSANFTVATNPVSVSTSAYISAVYNGITRSATLTVTAQPTPTTGAQFYVVPNGSASGDGSIAKPWDLQTALSMSAAVRPGDIIWLREGRYGSGGRTLFTSSLTGTQSSPIIVRQYPNERATVDGGIKANGAYTWFWGFEITNTSEVRDVISNITYDRPPGLMLYGQGNKAINLIINNTGRAGVGMWSNVTSNYEGEIYGCVFWGNGIYDATGTNGTRGDTIYANLADSNPLLASIRETVSFRNFNLGVKVYSEWSDRYVNNFNLVGNVAFDHPNYNILVENTYRGYTGLDASNNLSYQARTENRNSVKFGYPLAAQDNRDTTLSGNYFVSGTIGTGVLIRGFGSGLIATDNTFVSASVFTRHESSSASAWNSNKYYGGSASPFRVGSTAYTFTGWKAATGYEASGTYSPVYPTTKVIVRPNEYEPGRAHVIVYNWPHASAVDVDLSSVLSIGASFEIRDAQNYFGAPVVSGVYSGGLVTLPMNLIEVAPIIGNRHINNVHTDSEFGAFVVLTVSN